MNKVSHFWRPVNLFLFTLFFATSIFPIVLFAIQNHSDTQFCLSFSVLHYFLLFIVQEFLLIKISNKIQFLSNIYIPDNNNFEN